MKRNPYFINNLEAEEDSKIQILTSSRNALDSRHVRRLRQGTYKGSSGVARERLELLSDGSFEIGSRRQLHRLQK